MLNPGLISLKKHVQENCFVRFSQSRLADDFLNQLTLNQSIDNFLSLSVGHSQYKRRFPSYMFGCFYIPPSRVPSGNPRILHTKYGAAYIFHRRSGALVLFCWYSGAARGSRLSLLMAQGFFLIALAFLVRFMSLSCYT